MKAHTFLITACFLFGVVALARGDETPQPVDTSTLPPLGEKTVSENPYRGLPEAVKVGYSGYTQNCARCHGLEAISGGMTPDLRKMDSECMDMTDPEQKKTCMKDMDLYFIDAVFKGEARNGKVYMPPFKGIFNQEAIWAIRTYVESRRDAM